MSHSSSIAMIKDLLDRFDTSHIISDHKDVKERIFAALLFYQSLNMENKNDKNRLVHYYYHIYTQLLSDFITLITKHEADFESIYNYFTKQDASNTLNCNVEDCILSLRHNRNREKEIDDSKEDIDFIFIRDLFDNIHCYIYHQYDYGFRTNSTISDDTNNFKQEKEIPIDSTVNKNNKFSLKLVDAEYGSNTFMDELKQNILDDDNLINFIENEEFDTDAIHHDIADIEQSNILQFLSNDRLGYNNLLKYVKQLPGMTLYYSV